MGSAYQPTYTSLLAEVQDICENTNAEFVLNIPRFMQRAQDQIQRDLGLDQWRSVAQVTLTTTATLVRDPDWLIVRSLWLPIHRKWVEERSFDYVRAYGGIGRPRVWAEKDETTIILGPTPNSSYLCDVEVFERLAALTPDAPTNWITYNVGDLLLYQTLIQAASYMVSPERVQEFLQAYQMVLPTAVSELRDSERNRHEPIRAAPRPAMGAGASA